MGIDTGSYSYNISANADNTAYLWSGHGLTDVENPTLYFRDGDIVTISKIGGGHPLKITNDADDTFVLESGGILLLDPIEEGTYTYVCTSHAAMTGKILVGARYQGEGPDEGFGTGLLPTRNSPISVNQIRTKINEIITKGGVGGGKVTVSESPPDFPSEGNLWYDSSFAALFAYLEDYGWVQTNGAMGRAQSVIVNSSEPSDAQENDFWFDTINNVLKIYISGAWYAAAQTTQTSSSEGGDSGTSVDVSSTQPTNPENGDLWFNSSNSSLSVFSSGSWFRVDSRVLVTNLTPTSSETGDFWLNTDNNILYVNNGTSLVAINRIEVPIYDSNNRPTDAVNGDLFFNTDTSLVEVYNNAQWVSSGVSSSDLPNDISDLADSYGLLSSGANVTTNETAPANPADGDLWFNESVGSLFVYINGTGWVESNPGGESSSGGGASVTTGETAPTSPADGDLWYDTSVAKLYVYIDGTGWFQANGGGSSSGGGGDSVDFHSGTFHGEDANAVDHEIVIPVDSSGKCGGILELSDYATSTDQDEGGMMSWNFDASTGQIRMQQSWSGGESAYNKSSSVSATLTNTYQTIDISTSYQLYAWEAKYAGGNLYLTNNSHHGVWQATTSTPGSGGGGTGGSGTVEVLLDNVEFSTRIDGVGYYFTHSSSAPEIFDASALSVNQPVRIDIDVKLNGLDYYTDSNIERDVHIYWVKMKSPTGNTDTYKQGQHYRACWQQHVVLQRAGHTPAAYETPYRLHKELGGINSVGAATMFGETKYNYQDPDTQLVYRIGSDGKFYAFIPRASDTLLNNYGDGTSASGKIYYTMSARLTYL